MVVAMTSCWRTSTTAHVLWGRTLSSVYTSPLLRGRLSKCGTRMGLRMSARCFSPVNHVPAVSIHHVNIYGYVYQSIKTFKTSTSTIIHLNKILPLILPSLVWPCFLYQSNDSAMLTPYLSCKIPVWHPAIFHSSYSPFLRLAISQYQLEMFVFQL